MRTVTSILLLFILLLAGCNERTQDQTNNSEIAELAKSKFQAALKAEKEGDFKGSILLYDDAIDLYDQADSADLNYFKHLAYRFRANMLSKVSFHQLSVVSIDESIAALKASTYLPENAERVELELALLRYKGSYLRSAGDLQASNALLLELEEVETSIPNFHEQVKNLIGMNYRDLGDMESAYAQWDDILKVDDLKSELKAHYLNNRSYAAFYIGKKDEAYADINQAIGIASALDLPQTEMKFRMYLGDYYLIDGKYDQAYESMIAAVNTYEPIEQSPELFKIYNLLYSVSLALDLPEANQYKSKYEQLTLAHTNSLKRYNADLELAALKAELAQREFDEQTVHWTRALYINKTYAAIAASIALFFIGVAYLTRRREKRLVKVFNG